MDIFRMVTLTVDCKKFRARLTEHGCHMNQTVREECLRCEHRNRDIQYVGLLREFMKSRRSSTEDEQLPYKREVGGSSPSGGTNHNAGKDGSSMGLITPSSASDSRPRYKNEGE